MNEQTAYDLGSKIGLIIAWVIILSVFITAIVFPILYFIKRKKYKSLELEYSQERYKFHNAYNQNTVQIESYFRKIISDMNISIEDNERKHSEYIEKLKQEYQLVINNKNNLINSNENNHRDDIENLKQRYESSINNKENIIIYAAKDYKKMQKQFQSIIQNREDQILQLKKSLSYFEFDKWIESLRNVKYRNETEVEIKFVHTLVRFLGYKDEDAQIRVAIGVQVGRQQVSGQADWVLNRGMDKIIIEAKAPYQALDEQVKEQAMSYAFALRASLYVITNGVSMKVFRRGITTDVCLIDCEVSKMRPLWEKIEKILGK